MTANALPGFSPNIHAFPFPNSWEPGTPVVELPTPLGTIRLGNAAGGVCGGMVFAAADYWLAGRPAPREKSRELFRYFCRRLVDSFALPFGLMRYFDWQRRPSATNRLTHGVARLTILEEFPRIRSAIDAGLPALLGMVKAHSWRPQDLAQNHQVLAFGYAFDESSIRLDCYDPNWPGRTSTLTIDSRDPDADVGMEHSEEGNTVRGVFLVNYSRPDDDSQLPG
jgi:hypothetical protein